MPRADEGELRRLRDLVGSQHCTVCQLEMRPCYPSLRCHQNPSAESTHSSKLKHAEYERSRWALTLFQRYAQASVSSSPVTNPKEQLASVNRIVNRPGQVLFASLIGTAIEFFDFYIYAAAAVLVFPRLFFPPSDPVSATLASLATFAIAFLARPIGSALFGHFGDRIGRKTTLVAALLTMGLSTVTIGALPTYDTIGVFAPALLALCRFGQGLGLDGEWGGAVILPDACLRALLGHCGARLHARAVPLNSALRHSLLRAHGLIVRSLFARQYGLSVIAWRLVAPLSHRYGEGAVLALEYGSLRIEKQPWSSNGRTVPRKRSGRYVIAVAGVRCGLPDNTGRRMLTIGETPSTSTIREAHMAAINRRAFVAATAAGVAAPTFARAGECPAAGMDWMNMSLKARNLAYNNGEHVGLDYARMKTESWIAASKALREKRSKHLDVAYASGERTKWDLYPANDPKAPCFVHIHGGYWQRNSREVFAFLAEGPLARGWSAALPGYTIAPEASLTQITNEIRTAFDWLNAKSAEHGISGPIIVTGWSAGGHLTAFILDHPKVAAGVSISGVFDLAALRDSPHVNDKVKLTETEIETLSPMRRPTVDKPLAIAYGTGELPAMIASSRDYHAYRSQAHRPGDLVPVANTNHYTILDQLRLPDSVLTRAVLQMAEYKIS